MYLYEALLESKTKRVVNGEYVVFVADNKKTYAQRLVNERWVPTDLPREAIESDCWDCLT